MSKHSIVFALLLCSLSLFAQSTISTAEYWIDNDAGYGRGIAITLAGNTAVANIPTGGLSEGWHQLGLRSYGGDSWSQTYMRSFYVYSPGESATSITGAEYWVDTDPGHGLAQAIPYTSSQSSFVFTVPSTDVLSYGLHVIGMRVKRGHPWSATCTRAFMTLSPEEMANDITGAEYWIDDDPGYGSGTAIAFTAHQTQFGVNVPMDELSDGYHRIGLRVRYSNRWSQTYIREILNANFKPIMDVEKVEAYWDYDESNVFNVPFTVVDNHVEITGFPLSTAELSYGTHILSLRAVADDVPSVIMHYTVCKNATPLFAFGDEEACVNEELSIVDQSENVQANTTYAWDIDSNGKTDYTDKGNIVHTFTKAGTYTVTLTVQTGDGCESSYSKEIVVRAKTTPKVSLSRSKSSSCAGETVTFTATATNAGDSPTFTWLRNGNAIAGQTESVLEISELADNDQIQVQVTSSDRCPSTPTASSSTYTQRVYALPEVSLTFPEAFYSDAGTITLAGHGTPTGGTFYVDDTQMTSVNMATIGIGEHTLRYVVKNSNNCDAEQTVTFTVSERPKYTITFVDDDGITILQQSEVSLDAMPTPPADPTKEATAEFTYTFSGWSPTIVAATAAATYTATYTATVNKYLITFVDEDGTTVLASAEYEYGTTPVAPADPTKEATAQYTYTFAGWDKEIVAVTGAATYTATYTATVNKYLITFLNDDESVLCAEEYEYGAMPACDEPTKEPDQQYTYLFAGWQPEIVAVTSEATYAATYTAEPKQATAISNQQTTVGEQPIKLLHNGVLYILRAGKTYTVQGQEVR